MANVAKYSNYKDIVQILDHNDRNHKTYSNPDVDLNKSVDNYYLSPTRDVSSYSYYQHQLKKCHMFNRKDVVTLCEWVITAPRGLTSEECNQFFILSYQFLINRYYGGEDYVIQAVVHKDESTIGGHMHYTWIPIVPDPKHPGEYKVCCYKLITREELRDFHDALQKYMIDSGLPQARVKTGITREQGGNKTVRQLKEEQPYVEPVMFDAGYERRM